jgi:hypothetical protein
MSFTQETEHVAKAKARLVEQFKKATNLQALLSVLVDQLQEVDDPLWQLYTQRWVDLAEGVQLDNLGEIVGQEREARDDAEYRLWIKARVFANRSNGHTDDTLRILELVQPDADFSVEPTYPAAYLVHVYGASAPAQSLYNILTLAKPAGVRMNLLSDVDDATSFAFSDTSSLTTGDNARGFGTTTNPAIGGKLIGIL